MKIPMAVAGPMQLDGQYAKGEFFVPICTLEGTLAISMTRGMYASSISGGIRVRHVKQELSRAPVFIFEDLNDSFEFMRWIDEHYDDIKKVAESTTRHGKLLRVDQYPVQNYVILDMILDTGNAAGQNMVTLAAKVACDYIKEQTGHSFILESGFNSDKKASSRNMIMGRGHSVLAEVTLTHSIMKRFLGITAKDVERFQQIGPTITTMAGTSGCHLHVSNALTAIYLATGQDTACVAENAMGHFLTEQVEHGIKCRLTLPSLTVGTVGGGTRLLPQQQNLEFLGCNDGDHSARKLAEIIGASALALEISLMSAIASDTFAMAHMKYGRK
jgi:hydroxymethylglutaryl-CoA reductase (NADPH)